MDSKRGGYNSGMKIKDLIKELATFDGNMEVVIGPANTTTYEEAFSLTDIIEYEEKELAEDEDGYIHDLEYDELDKNSIRREFKAIVFYPIET